MVLSTPTMRQLDPCRPLIEGQAKNLADRLYGPDGPALGILFSELEQLALAVTNELRKQLLDLLLLRQAEAMHRNLAEEYRICPSCGQGTVAAEPEPRLLHTRAGIVEWMEPSRYCRPCRKAFFPQTKLLGIDTGNYSAGLLDLIVYAGANKPSFREASCDLDKMSGQNVKEKQVERLTKRIGQERLDERQAAVEHFAQLPLTTRCDHTPAGVQAPTDDLVAVVMADAGMLQLRDTPDQPDKADESLVALLADAAQADELEDDDYDQQKPPSGRHWREDKVGLVMTMTSEVSDVDPCPEIPETFIDQERVGKIVRGLKKSAALSAEEEEGGDSTSAEASAEPAVETVEAEYEGPKLESRQVLASRKSWPIFGVMLACMAWGAGFAKAKRKAFVADGARAIWRVWKSRFSSYVPVLDFIHAMSYVYAAAKAVGENNADGWRLYAHWIRLVWQGQVAAVIKILEDWQQSNGKPEKGESKTTARSVVAKSLGYLTNNQDKMKYDEYRKQGLPLVSSLMESMVKQISRRVKGTEKFWGESGAEAVLQLRADYLSDGEVMERFWQRRQETATGFRPYRTNS